MPEVHEGPGYRYLDYTEERIEDSIKPLLKQFLEAAVITIRDEIVAVINEGSPSGDWYRLPAATAPFKRNRWTEESSRIAGKWYRASAPGEAPAERTGRYRRSWDVLRPADTGTDLIAGVTNDVRVGDANQYALWAILEYGTTELVGGGGATGVRSVVAPRPHIERGMDRAKPKIRRIARRIDLDHAVDL